MNLSELVGQDHAVTCLSRAVVSGRVGHAYLFFGPAGVGKRTAALAFARSLNCESPGMSGESCGECAPCREIEAGSFPDLMLVVPESEDGKLPSFHKEQVSAVIKRASLTASPRHRKVFILEDIHLMSPEASNSLLKIIEEPPPRTVWLLLTSEPGRILATIRSRCQAVRFNLLPRRAVSEIMRRGGVETGEAEAALMMGQLGGSPSEIAELAGQAGEFIGQAERFDLAGMSARSKELSKDNEALDSLLDGLERVFGERLRNDSGGAAKWVAALDAVAQARLSLRRYAQKTLVDSLGAELALIFRREARA